ncbi:MAG: LytR C-terminal domain-containing protein [Actinomycetota bacterium]|nr:LytR C-terminal domain-containing protein [Actinomycetota bacterium]
MVDKPAGRHSAGDQTAFYRSAALWFLPWVVVAVVAIAAVWIAVDAIGNDVQPAPAKNQKNNGGAAADPTPDAEKEPEVEETETDEPTPSASPSPSPSPDDEEEDDKPKLITEGISVQVLNGTSDAEADDRVAEQLESLGYEIGAVNPYLARPDTIVFFSSEESRRAAEALAEHFGWPVRPKPEDLSPEVSIHVIVGADELVASD